MGRDNLHLDSQGIATQLAIRGDFGQIPDESKFPLDRER
jgi:hypothetical protein